MTDLKYSGWLNKMDFTNKLEVSWTYEHKLETIKTLKLLITE